MADRSASPSSSSAVMAAIASTIAGSVGVSWGTAVGKRRVRRARVSPTPASGSWTPTSPPSCHTRPTGPISVVKSV